METQQTADWARCKFMLSCVVWAPSAVCQSFIYPLFVKFFSISSATVVDFLGLPLPASPGLHPEQKSQFLRPPWERLLLGPPWERLWAPTGFSLCLWISLLPFLPHSSPHCYFKPITGEMDIVISVFPQPLIFNTFCKTVLLWIFLVSLYLLSPPPLWFF